MTLIKGCFVALTTNSFGAESGLANNTAGKVVGFKRILLAGGYVNLPEVLFDGFTRPYVVPWIVETVKRDGVLTKRAGLPLRLNHSVTIHKMQGCTTRHRIHAGTYCSRARVTLVSPPPRGAQHSVVSGLRGAESQQ